VTPGGDLAHGDVPPAPSAADVVGAWTFEPVVWVGVVVLAVVYLRGARRVAGWPRGRSRCFVSGLAVLLVALSGSPAVYEGALFSAHMAQHLLLTLVAAPLLVFGAPVTLVLRSARPPARRILTRVLHSRTARALGRPLTGWTALALVMWGTHYSPIYDAALESEPLHAVEHALFLGAASLFWVPVAGLDPAPRLTRPLRVAYLLAALPVQSFLGLALYSADALEYPHYATLDRSWGPDPLDDQRAGAMVMWLGGDALLLTWTAVAAAAWLRAEEAEEARADRRAGTRRGAAP
jgi:cytochrome c oxidase assembly factor CtaG